MKLNEKGKVLAQKWGDIWMKHIDEVEAGTAEDMECGWSAIEWMVETIEDECGLMMCVYGDDAFYEIWGNDYVREDDPWFYGKDYVIKKREILWLLATQYFTMEYDEDMEFVIELVS